MEENLIRAEGAFEPEAATDEPVSPVNPHAADDADEGFASPEAEAAWWRGVAHGIRTAGREPAHPHMPADFDLDLTRASEPASLVSRKPLDAVPLDEEIAPRSAFAPAKAGAQPLEKNWVPASAGTQFPGFTPEKRRLFLEALAACGVAADACRVAGISRPTAYNLRNSAEGAAFALAWNAAKLLARGRMADELFSRAMCGVVERVYRNGELVAERHRYDNRLSLAVLTRLDRQAEGLGEGAAPARLIAQEWDQFLDIVESGEGAAAFLQNRAPKIRPGTARGTARSAVEGSARRHEAEQLESAATRLARLETYTRHGAGLPREIATGDLDPASMAQWTEAQWQRAEASGLLDRLKPADWPDAARAPEPPDGDGMCKMCKAYADRHPPEDEAEDDFGGRSVWDTDEGEWVTDFPPPPDFDGWEEGDPADDDYRRQLSDAEQESLAPELAEIEAEKARALAALHAARDRYFGFAAGMAPEDAAEAAATPVAPLSRHPAPSRHPGEGRDPGTPKGEGCDGG